MIDRNGERQEKPAKESGFRLPGKTAFLYRDYRLYWTGFVAQVSGLQMLWVAQGWLIYELSGSAAMIGVAGLARALPATALSLVGGALADKMDQRALLIRLQALQVGLLALLGTLTLSGGVEVWHLLLIVSASAASDSLESPARQAIFPRLIPRSAIMDAVATNSTVYPGTRFVAPLLAGLLMSQIRLVTGEALIGAAVLFYLTALGYLVSAAFLYVIRLEAVTKAAQTQSVMRDMQAGIRFVLVNSIFSALILMTYCTQFFGWASQSLFPVFAKDIYHGGELELGLMGSLLGAGSLIGAMTASNLAAVKRRGLLIVAGFISQAVLVVAFSVAPTLAIALGLLLLMGWAQSVFAVTSQATLHYLVPNEFRGRVMGIWAMTHTAVQPLGQLELGLVAGATSAPFAVATGGITILAAGLLFVIPNARIRNLSNLLERESSEAAEPLPVVGTSSR